MATGAIKTIVKERGFGFIQPNGSQEDVFFHSSALPQGAFDQLRQGQAVEFDTEPDPRNSSRRRAVNLRILDEASS